jgi:hypothetical protein
MNANSASPNLITARLQSSPGQIRIYAELQRRIHHDLRVQHPEWVKPNGESPICDLYERRLAELIAFFQSTEINLFAA